MLVLVQFVGLAVVPLNVTVLDPCVAPKYAPARVTVSPMWPLDGVTAVRVGARRVNVTPLLYAPVTVATTEPVVAPTGTGATMFVSDHKVGVAVVPLNLSVLLPWELPNRVPTIETSSPTWPLDAVTDVMVGGRIAVTVPLVARRVYPL